MGIGTVLGCARDLVLTLLALPTFDYLKPVEISEPDSQLEHVDCIYVLNLDRQTKRWERVQSLFSHAGLKINRVSGVDGWLLEDQVLQSLGGKYQNGLRKGQVGCLLSHISALKDAFDRNFNLVWILEDDIHFAENIDQLPRLIETLSTIDPKWGIFYTDPDSKTDAGDPLPFASCALRPDYPYHRGHDYTYSGRKVFITNDLLQIGRRFGMYSYFISREGIEKLINHFSNYPLYFPIDIDIHHIPGLRQYCVTRDIVTCSLDFLTTSDTREQTNKP